MQGADGVRYTRNGRFSAAPDGALATATGETVLGRNGQPVRVAADGTVDPPDALQVVALTNPRKAGEGFFTGQAGAQVPARERPQRRARGLRLGPGPRDGRHDRLDARVRGRPARHPHDRRHARQGGERRRRSSARPCVQPRRTTAQEPPRTSD